MNLYFQIRTTVWECLGGYDHLKWGVENLNAGINILTRIALRQLYLAPSLEIKEKIRAIVLQKIDRFKVICETGIYFPCVRDGSLEFALSEETPSFFIYLLNGHSKWEEEELNRRFGEALKQLEIGKVLKVCEELLQDYRYNSWRSRSEYYLFWVIKNVAGCDYAIPSKYTEGLRKPVQYFWECFRDGARVENPIYLMQLLLSPPLEYWFFREIGTSFAASMFRTFAHRHLKETSMEMGPIKYELIEKLMIRGSASDNSALAEHLAQSQDPTTAKIGFLLSQAIQAASLTAALPYYKELKKCSSFFGHDFIRKVFKEHIVDFLKEGIQHKNPEFTHYLPFSPNYKVFICGSMMIGVCEEAELVSMSILCAFDMDTKELLWAISIDDYGALSRVEDTLVIWYQDKSELWMIDVKSGECHVAKFEDSYRDLYMTSKVIYRASLYRGLYGTKVEVGKFEKGLYESSCDCEVGFNDFVPFSTHWGAQRRINYGFACDIINPSGKFQSIHYKNAQAYGDKLFTINSSPNQCQGGLLLRRTLKLDEEVLGPVEKSIDLPEGNFKIEGLCDNGQLILLSERAVLFVDQEKESVEVVSCEGAVNECFVIDTLKAEVWWRDQSTSHLWKVNSKEAHLMGSLKSTSDVSLVHVDSAGKLYYMDRL